MSQYLGDISAYALAVSQGYTGTEEEYAELMASYATVGQTAVTAAQTATTKASEAATSATTATNKATEATTAATTATTKAGEASTSASTATSAKDTAVSASQTATTKASEATTAAATATSAATTATTAKDDAVSAKTAAQTAQTGAETAAASVSASAEQIATNAEDISQLKSDLNDKANVDGYYADLVSGGSTQLLSDMVETDTTPYNYRTAGGSLEIGDREKLKKIVGGSLAVNQIVQNGNFADGTTGWAKGSAITSNTISVSDGVITASDSNGTAWFGFKSNNNGSVIVGHKYIATMDVKASIDGLDVFNVYADDTCLTRANSSSQWVSVNTSWKKLASVFNCIASGYASLGCRKGAGSYGSELSIYGRNVNLFDLTLMFGTTIADYVYGLETATAGAGAAWLKAHFPKIFDACYIPYNVGTLEHVSGLSAHKMVGFNQWDETTFAAGVCLNSAGTDVSSNASYATLGTNANPIKVVPGQTYKVSVDGAVSSKYYVFFDANKNIIGQRNYANSSTAITVPEGAHYIRISVPCTDTTYKDNICVHLHWDGERDGEYEAYNKHSYPLDSDVTLRGIPKLDANNNLYYDGDEYETDGTVTRRYKEVNLGELSWQTYTQNQVSGFYTQTFANKALNFNFICAKYPNGNNGRDSIPDKSCGTWNVGGNRNQIVIRDSDYNDPTAFKNSLSGVYLVYELATPTTESADPYTEIQNVSNWGTEEFVSECLVPVGHETAYQPDLRAKIEVAPESPDTDGLYLMKRENGQNSYVAYLGELPSDPSEDGTYTLKCTVSGGTATKTWEADT